MVEPEVAFATLADNAKLAEDMLKYVFRAVLAERKDDLKFFEKHVDKDVITRLENFVNSDFAQIDYTDAIDVLLKSGKNQVKNSSSQYLGVSICLLNMNVS